MHRLVLNLLFFFSYAQISMWVISDAGGKFAVEILHPHAVTMLLGSLDWQCQFPVGCSWLQC